MATGITTASALTNHSRTIIGEARFVEQHTGVMRGLVERFTLPKGATTVQVNRYTSATASALTDGVDFTSSHTLASTGVALTSSEYGVKIIVTKKQIRQNADDVMRAAGKVMGAAMGVKFDTVLLALFDAYTLDTVPGTGQPVELEDISMCLATLYATALADGGPAPEPISVVLHPLGIHDVVSELTTGVWGTLQIPHGLTEDVVKNYFKGKDKIWGVPFFFDGNITVTSNDAIGAIFSKGSLCYIMSKEWEIENEYDASLRAYEMIAVADYGAFTLVDKWGAELKHDVAALVS